MLGDRGRHLARRRRPRRPRSRSSAAAEHHRQPGAHQRVVVDDQDADRRRLTPATAATPAAAKSPARVAAVLEPAAGQRGPLGQADQPGAGARDRGAAARRPAAGLRTSTVRPSPGAPATSTVDGGAAARACARWSAPPARSGRRCGPTPSGTAPRRRASVEASRACPAPRDSSTSAGRSASVGCGRLGRRRRGSRRAARRAPRAGPRAPGARWSGSTPGRPRDLLRRRVGPELQRARRAGVSSEIRWASTSCISRAIRARSAAARLLDAQLLLGLGPLGAVAQRADELAPGADEHAPGDAATPTTSTTSSSERHSDGSLLGSIAGVDRRSTASADGARSRRPARTAGARRR